MFDRVRRMALPDGRTMVVFYQGERHDICAVCGWEDDRCDMNRIRGGPDAPSVPNHISLTQGRENFARFGASKEKSKKYVRDPRPEEHP